MKALPLHFEFTVTEEKQKVLIDAILKYSGLHLLDLAHILGMPEQILKKVFDGHSFLTGEQKNNLVVAFLSYFSH